MANGTRSLALSPIQKHKRKYDVALFRKVWDKCARNGLGVQDVAHQLKWHIDDVIYVARQVNDILSACGEGLPMLRRY